MPPRLQMQGVHKLFGATHALRGIDLEVNSGEVLALVGENGAGKSTLMKVLSGAHRPDQGKMWLDGCPFAPRHPLQARRSGVAMIYQELSLAPHLSIMENILLGIEPTTGPFIRWPAMRQKAIEAMATVGLKNVAPETQLRNLPIACQQMVEIARAVALECRVLVLDEPTSSMAQRDTQRLFQLIRRLKTSGLAIVYISHFLEEVKKISDRYVVLRDGETVGQGVTSEARIDQIVSLMVGRKVDELYPRSRRKTGQVVLALENVTGNRRQQLQGLASLELRRGEVLGIAGLVGAGRTELLRTIFGLDPVKSGTIRVGTWRGPAGPTDRWLQGVGMVSENRKTEGLALNLSVADNITLPKLSNLGPCGLVLPRRQKAAAEHWVSSTSIKCVSADQAVNSLSGGNQQKVALARLLYADVDLLLLDEPTRGIDVGSKAQIYRIIDQLTSGDASAGRLPKAVLLVSSYLPELMGVCDRIAVMCRATLGEPRPVADWNEHSLMLAATGQDTLTEPRIDKSITITSSPGL